MRTLTGLSLLALCLSAVLAEMGLRVFRPTPTPGELNARSLQYAPSLFARSVFPRERQPEFGINRWGFRGPDFSWEKPAGLIRILVLGGSGAFDIHAKAGEDWPSLVGEWFRARGLPVEVINGGIPGHSSADVLGRYYGEGWMLRPDYVLFYEAWNDIKFFDVLSPPRTLLRELTPPPALGNRIDNPFLLHRSFLDRWLTHSQLYVHLRNRYWRWRFSPGPEGVARRARHHDTYPTWGLRQYELDLRLFTRAVRASGAAPVLLTQAHLVAEGNSKEAKARIPYDYAGLTFPALVRAFDECDATVRRVADEENVPLVDTSRRLSGKENLFADHVHMTAAGSRALAREVASALLDRIRATHYRKRP